MPLPTRSPSSSQQSSKRVSGSAALFTNRKAAAQSPKEFTGSAHGGTSSVAQHLRTISMSSNVYTPENVRALRAEVDRPDRAVVEAAFQTIIRWTDDDPERDGLIDTHARVACFSVHPALPTRRQSAFSVAQFLVSLCPPPGLVPLGGFACPFAHKPLIPKGLFSALARENRPRAPRTPFCD
jgi:hypothetical protein